MAEIDWDLCPHQRRFEEQVRHMEEMTKQVVSAVSAKIDSLAEAIRQELRHNHELTEQAMQNIRNDINSVGNMSRQNRDRIGILEDSLGRRAVAAWKWVAGIVGTVAAGVLVGWILRAFVGG